MSRDNVELVRRTFELWDRGADDELADHMAPDVEWHHNIGMGTPAEGIYRGRQQVLALFDAVRESFGFAQFELEEVCELSSTEVLALGCIHLEGRGSGAPATASFGSVMEIVDGLAVRNWFWFDRSKALEAVGLR